MRWSPLSPVVINNLWSEPTSFGNVCITPSAVDSVHDNYGNFIVVSDLSMGYSIAMMYLTSKSSSWWMLSSVERHVMLNATTVKSRNAGWLESTWSHNCCHSDQPKTFHNSSSTSLSLIKLSYWRKLIIIEQFTVTCWQNNRNMEFKCFVFGFFIWLTEHNLQKRIFFGTLNIFNPMGKLNWDVNS